MGFIKKEIRVIISLSPKKNKVLLYIRYIHDIDLEYRSEIVLIIRLYSDVPMVSVTRMVVSHTNRTNMINGIGQNIGIRSIPFLSHERIREALKIKTFFSCSKRKINDVLLSYIVPVIALNATSRSIQPDDSSAQCISSSDSYS